MVRRIGSGPSVILGRADPSADMREIFRIGSSQFLGSALEVFKAAPDNYLFLESL